MIFSQNICAQSSTQNEKWTIAAQKFTFSDGQQKNSVTNQIENMISLDFLAKLSNNLKRNIKPDEKLERIQFKLHKDRLPLFLQLSSEYKKRDSLFLGDYSEKKLQQKIKEQNKKIKEIEDKIKLNLQELKNAEKETQINNQKIQNNDFIQQNELETSEFEKFKNLFTNIFTKDKSLITQENILVYKEGNVLFELSKSSKEEGITSSKAIKEIYNAGISTLFTGNITNYGEFLSVNVDVYLYPKGEKIGSVMEIGSLNEIDLICSGLANQIIPLLTNSMPSKIIVEINNKENQNEFINADIYIDDVLQKKSSNNIFIVNSGVHSIQITCDDYNTVATSYFFEGNENYKININLTKKNVGNLTIVNEQNGKVLEGNFFTKVGIIPFVDYSKGSLYVNGENVTQNEETHYKIKINGKTVLGQFITENGTADFFYIPEKLNIDNNYIKIKPKPYNKSDFIDKRRIWMYSSYSAFMVSLIPTFITSGLLENNAKLYSENRISYEEANKWQSAKNICTGISIGLGVFWGIELVRYFIAADSLIPQNAQLSQEN